MQTEPKVSIVLPIHGAAPFLMDTIQSVLKVKYQKLEVICVLDRPSDKTKKLVIDTVKHNYNWKIHHSLNPGISNALNLGILNSSGDLIARIDSDDIIHPDRITKQVEVMRRKRNVVLVGTQMTFIDVYGKQTGRTYYPTKNFSIKKLIRVRNCIGHPTVLFSKDVFLKTDGYRTQLDGAEDLDLWFQMSSFGQFINLNEELTQYRISAIQQTNVLKRYPGLMDEAVFISNSHNGPNFLRAIGQGTSKSVIKETLDSILLRISITDPSFGRSLRASRNLWKFESYSNEVQILSLHYFLKALAQDPNKSLVYAIYALRCRFFGRRKRDIT